MSLFPDDEEGDEQAQAVEEEAPPQPIESAIESGSPSERPKDYRIGNTDPRRFTGPLRDWFKADVKAAEDAARGQDMFDRTMARAAAQKQAADDRLKAASEKQAVRDLNTKNEEAFVQKGVKYRKYSDGILRPVRDEEGNVRYHEKKGAVEYDESGKPFQETRDEKGVVTREDPDAKAPLGTHPTDAGTIYLQNKHSAWSPVATVTDGLNSADPEIQAAAMKSQETIDRHQKIAVVSGARAMMDDLNARRAKEIAEFPARNKALEALTGEIAALEARAKETTHFWSNNPSPDAQQARTELEQKKAQLEQLGEVMDPDSPEAKESYANEVKLRSGKAARFRLLVEETGSYDAAMDQWRAELAANSENPDEDPILHSLDRKRQSLGLGKPAEAKRQQADDEKRRDPRFSKTMEARDKITEEHRLGEISAEEANTRMSAIQGEERSIMLPEEAKKMALLATSAEAESDPAKRKGIKDQMKKIEGSFAGDDFEEAKAVASDRLKKTQAAMAAMRESKPLTGDQAALIARDLPPAQRPKFMKAWADQDREMDALKTWTGGEVRDLSFMEKAKVISARITTGILGSLAGAAKLAENLNVTGQIASYLTGGKIGSAPQQRMLGEVANWARDIQEYLPTSASVQGAKVMNGALLNPNWWIEKGVPSAVELAVDLGISALTGPAAPYTFMALGGAKMAGESYNEAEAWHLEQGKSELEAKTLATGEGLIVGVIGALLDRIPAGEFLLKNELGKKVFFNFVRNRMAKRGLVGFSAEAVPEIGQELTSMLAEAGFRDPSEAFHDGVDRLLTAGVLGGAMGTGADIMIGAVNDRAIRQDIDQLRTINGALTDSGLVEAFTQSVTPEFLEMGAMEPAAAQVALDGIRVRIEQAAKADDIEALQAAYGERLDLAGKLQRTAMIGDAIEEIDSLSAATPALSGIDQPAIEATKAAARGMIKIANGMPVEALTSAERAAIEAPSSDWLPRLEMVKGADGKKHPVLTQGAIDRLAAVAPRAAELIGQNEAERRRAVTTAPPEPATAPTAAGKPSPATPPGGGESQVASPAQKSTAGIGEQSPTQARELTAEEQGRVKIIAKNLEKQGATTEAAQQFAREEVTDTGTSVPMPQQLTAAVERRTAAEAAFGTFEVSVEGEVAPRIVKAASEAEASALVAGDSSTKGMVGEVVMTQAPKAPQSHAPVSTASEPDAPEFTEARGQLERDLGRPLNEREASGLRILVKKITPEIQRWNGVFTGGVNWVGHLRNGRGKPVPGLAQVNTKTTALRLSVARITRNAQNLIDGGGIEHVVTEEAIHLVSEELQNRGAIDMDAMWAELPEEVKDTVRDRVDRKGVYDVMIGDGTAREIDNREQVLAREWWRLFIQGSMNVTADGWSVDGKPIVTEQITPSFLAKIRDALTELFRVFSNLREELMKLGASAEYVDTLEQARDLTLARLKSVDQNAAGAFSEEAPNAELPIQRPADAGAAPTDSRAGSGNDPGTDPESGTSGEAGGSGGPLPETARTGETNPAGPRPVGGIAADQPETSGAPAEAAARGGVAEAERELDPEGAPVRAALRDYFTGRMILVSDGTFTRPLANYLPAGSPLARGATIGTAIERGWMETDGKGLWVPNEPASPPPSEPETAPDAEPTPATGEEAPQTAEKPKRSFRFRLPEAPGGTPDMLDHLIDNYGKIRSAAAARRAGSTVGGEYDGASYLPGGVWWNAIFTSDPSTGNRPDEAAQVLFEMGFLKDASPDTLWEALKSAIQSRKKIAGETRGQSEQERQIERFQKDAIEPRDPEPDEAILVDDLKVGDIVTVEGEALEVATIAPNGTVRLKDGKRYGVQSVEAGKVIYGEMEEAENNTEPEIDPSQPFAQDQTGVNESADTQRAVTNEEAGQVLDRVIAELPENLRAVVEGLREGRTLEEIGEGLDGLSKQAIFNRSKMAFAQLRRKLGERGIRGTDDLMLAAQPQFDDTPLDNLMRMLDLEALGDLAEKAQAEKPGEFTTGRPDLALGAKNADIRAVDEWRKGNVEAQTHEEWEQDARTRLNRDYEGEMQKIVRIAMMPGGQLNPVETKMAQMIITEESEKPRSDEQRRRLQSIAWANRQTGTEQARSFGARRDREQSPEARNRLFLTKAIYTPPVKVRTEIEAAKTPAEKQRLLDADAERIAKIEAELRKMGVNLDDILAGEVVLRLKGAQIVQNIVQTFDEKRQKAFRLLQGGTKTFDEVAKEVGLKPSEVEAVRDEFVAEFERKHFEKFMKGAKAEQIDAGLAAPVPGMLSAQDPGVSEAEARAEFEKALRMMGIVPKIDQGAFKVVKRKRRKASASPESSTGQPPSDSPVGPMATKQGDLLNPERNADRMPTDVSPVGNTSGTQQKLLPPEPPFEEWMYRKELADPAAVARVARMAQAATGNGFDMAYEYWINGILSGPATHAANIAGNALSTAWDFSVQRGMEAMLNLVYRDANGAQLGEFRHLLAAITPGVARGFKLARMAWGAEADFFKSSVLDQQIEMFDEYEKGGGVRPAIPGKTGRVVRIPGRSLLFMDSLFKGVIGQMEASAQAYRIGRAEGLRGDALQRRMRTLINTPGSEAWQRAVEKAVELTFQEKSVIGEITGSIKGMKDHPETGYQIAGRLFAFVMPFLNTPWNIFKMGMRKTPLGTFNVLGRFLHAGIVKIRNGKPIAETYLPGTQIKHLAEQSIGWGAMLLLWGFAQGDDDDEEKKFLVTGSMPFKETTRGERELQQRAYGGSYMIRVGGRGGFEFNYGRYEPIATVLGTVVDMIRSMKRGTPAADKVDALWGYFVAQAQSKTFLQAQAEMLAALQDGTGMSDKMKRAFAQAIVPNIIRQPLRNLDDFARDQKGADFSYQLLPAASNAPAKIDVYGKPVEKGGNALTRIAITSGTKPDDIQTAADKLLLRWNQQNPADKWAPAPPERTYKVGKETRQMTGAEYETFSRRVGERVNRLLAGKIGATAISNPKETDVKAIQNAFERARREAKAELFPDRPKVNVRHAIWQ